MNRRPLPLLLPLICLAAFAPSAAQAQTLPTLTATLTGSGTTNFKSGPLAYQNYTFNLSCVSGFLSW